MKDVYVVSRCRNPFHSFVVSMLEREGLSAYDFNGSEGFDWSDISQNWETWTMAEFAAGLSNELAINGFNSNMDAIKEAKCLVLVLPCGNSAHIEAGYAAGLGKPVLIYAPAGCKPELMYSMAKCVTSSIKSIVGLAREIVDEA